jgi:hypothetical protein
MQAKFYMDVDNLLWDAMKHDVCQKILEGVCGYVHPRYYIHFDKMIFNIGWFWGFVEIWKGKQPYERRVRRIPFVVHVTDWEGHDECKKRANYRVVNKG